MNRKVTLKFLASHLGVSVTTVSRALADYSDVSEETKIRVRRAVEEFGYQPNSAARGLVTGRAGAIGLIIPANYGDFRNPFYSQLLLSVGRSLHEADPHTDLIVSTAPPGPEELLAYDRAISSGRVDGFIITETRVDDPRVAWLEERNIPYVMHGRVPEADGRSWVDTDGESGLYDATQYLIDLGHKHIAMLNLPDDLYTSRLRQRGYVMAMEQSRLVPQVVHLRSGDRHTYEKVRDMLSGSYRPSAFVCATDAYAVPALRAVEDAGLTPGRDVSIIGSDNLSMDIPGRYQLSTLDVSFDDVCDSMISILLLQLQSGFPARKSRLFPYRILKRDTTGQCGAS